MEKNKYFYKIHVVPGSKLNQVAGFMEDGSIKIKIKAKPTEGQANKALIKYLSGILKIKEKEIEIYSGLTSRNKVLKLGNLEKNELQQRLSREKGQEP